MELSRRRPGRAWVFHLSKNSVARPRTDNAVGKTPDSRAHLLREPDCGLAPARRAALRFRRGMRAENIPCRGTGNCERWAQPFFLNLSTSAHRYPWPRAPKTMAACCVARAAHAEPPGKSWTPAKAHFIRHTTAGKDKFLRLPPEQRSAPLSPSAQCSVGNMVPNTATNPIYRPTRKAGLSASGPAQAMNPAPPDAAGRAEVPLTPVKRELGATAQPPRTSRPKKNGISPYGVHPGQLGRLPRAALPRPVLFHAGRLKFLRDIGARVPTYCSGAAPSTLQNSRTNIPTPIARNLRIAGTYGCMPGTEQDIPGTALGLSP